MQIPQLRALPFFIALKQKRPGQMHTRKQAAGIWHLADCTTVSFQPITEQMRPTTATEATEPVESLFLKRNLKTLQPYHLMISSKQEKNFLVPTKMALS